MASNHCRLWLPGVAAACGISSLLTWAPWCEMRQAENLNQQAFKFRKQSSALKKAMWMKNLKLYALVAFILGVSQ